MRVLIVGAGGVGSAIAIAAKSSESLSHIAVADVDPGRAERAVASLDEGRFVARQVDASDAAIVAELARAEAVDVVVNACDARFNPPIFRASYDAGCHYLDMGLTLSTPHPERPYELPGVLLGEAQFAATKQWEER